MAMDVAEGNSRQVLKAALFTRHSMQIMSDCRSGVAFSCLHSKFG